MRVYGSWLLSSLFALFAALAKAQVPAPRPNETTAPAVPPKQGEAVRPLSAEDVTAFMDGLVPIQLDRSDEVGAVVVVIRDTQVLLKKGYGYSDVEKKTPVDPELSGFRPGSISKLFTWISLMQLKEQGRLNLDADVNQYLDFQIREQWHKPVTARDLMTHRPGFEETLRDLIRKAPAPVIPLRQYLIDNQPAQIFPPGDVPAYSNYGAGLAGYMVQRISGQRYEDYVRLHIFEPLGMSHSSFEQPLPKNWPVRPVSGYAKAEDKMLPFEMVSPAPAGALTTTGADMIRFALALLHSGELDAKRILQPQTLVEMWTPQFRSDPNMPAMCLGFYEQRRDRTRWVGHGGDLIAYHSLFMLQPESKTAFFVSYNTAGSDRGVSIERAEFFNQFVDRYFGPPSGALIVAKGQETPSAEVEGTYWSTRRGVTNRLQFLNLTDQRKVSADKEGNLIMADSKSISGETIHWRPIARDLWAYPEGQSCLAAVRDSRGRVVRLASSFPAIQLERVPWYANSRLNHSLLAVAVFTMLCVVWAAVLRLIQRKRRAPDETPVRRLRAVQIATSVFWLVTLIALTAFMHSAESPSTFPPSHAFDSVFLAIDIVISLAILLSVWTAVHTVRAWRLLPKAFWLRVRVVVIAFSALFLVWFSFYWKLVGPVSHY
jgi:CubicO group peptidase (beta-lactamase class C family)